MRRPIRQNHGLVQSLTRPALAIVRHDCHTTYISINAWKSNRVVASGQSSDSGAVPGAFGIHAPFRNVPVFPRLIPSQQSNAALSRGLVRESESHAFQIEEFTMGLFTKDIKT